ncbi:MAG TPA: chain-length determining protein, partial [Prevotella sp.]
MNKIENNEQINVKDVLLRILARKWFILKCTGIAFVAACIFVFPIPRYYNSTVELAPELGNINPNGGGLADIASSMGFNINGTMLGDAISPGLYPELLKSNNFIIHLTNCRVKTSDGLINTTYYDYLAKHQKRNPLGIPLNALK